MVIHGKRLAQARLTSVKAASTENVYAATALRTLGTGFETTTQRGSVPLGPHGPYGSEQLLERFPLHRGDVAVVMEDDRLVAKLTSDDAPTAAEDLKLLLTLNADAKPEALYRPKRIINISNWVIATNDNDGPAQCLDRRQPDDCLGAPLLLPNQFFCVDPPQPIRR